MAADQAGADLARRPLEALERRLGETLGLSLRECAPEGVVPRLRHRIEDRALDGPEAYAEYLLYSSDRSAWEDLAETLTANESRVFDSPGDFTPLFEMATDPDWIRLRQETKPFRCLSAGCGTGEEAYSLAAVLAEARTRAHAFQFEVIGADLSARAVMKARRGTGPHKSSVRFARLNLCEPDSLLCLGAFDLILARGFLFSLTSEGRRAALANLARALAPGGILLLGPEDSIGETDLGLMPVRWGDRYAYESPDPVSPAPAHDPGEGPDPGLALVAHRSALVRAWVRILLELRGLRVEEASHGVRALERAALGGPPSFYLLERTLPPRGGSWVSDRIVSLGVAKPESVVYLSPGERVDGDPPTIGIPLTRQSLDSVLGPPAP